MLLVTYEELPLLRRVCLCVVLLPVCGLAQQVDAGAKQAEAGPQQQVLSPKAAFDLAMQPLSLTRSAIGNWSESELAALTVTMKRARTECDARDATKMELADLPDMLKLCALGQEWPTVVDSASRYLHADMPTKPRVSEVYAALVDAELRTKDEPGALRDAKAMLAAAPYDALEAYAVNEALDYMEFNFNADALMLAKVRQPLLLQVLRGLGAPGGASGDAAKQTVHELYVDGLDLPTLQQLAKEPGVEATVAALEGALPSEVKADDGIPIAAARRRYALLGKPLPEVMLAKWPKAKTYLEDGGMQPEVPTLNVTTALLLFPDWCAQCVRMGSQFPETVFRVLGKEAYLYGLLAETVAPDAPAAINAKEPSLAPSSAANRMAGTNTIAVDASMLEQFDVTEPPFLIVVDASGMVRVAQAVTTDAVQPANTADSAIAFVNRQWPLLFPQKRPPMAVPPHS